MARLRSEMEAIIARYSSRHPGAATPVPGLHVGRFVAPVPPMSHVAEACVCVCVRGARSLSLGDAVYAHDQDRFLLSSIGLPAIVAIERASPKHPYTALRIDLDSNLAREVLTNLDSRSAGAPLEPGLSFGQIDYPFLDALARLVRLIESPEDIPFMSGLVHREILYRLLSGPSGARLRQIVRLDSQGNRVARTAAWLRTHYRERITIERLATIAGMAPSTLHRHFHELTNMSPLQYQKHLRLHEARRRLLDDGENVASTAFEVGYESSTQFIREYSRLFGRPPLRDVKALRATGERPRVI